MSRRSAASLFLAGLLFADGSWLGRLEQLFHGILGGDSQPRAVWAASDCGGSIDPNGQPAAAPSGARDLPIGFAEEKGAKIDPNG